jgi:hypothetical protein
MKQLCRNCHYLSSETVHSSAFLNVECLLNCVLNWEQYIVTCFEVTRHTRLQGNSPLPRIRGSLRIGVPDVTSQQSYFSERQSVVSLRSARPGPVAHRAVQQLRAVESSLSSSWSLSSVSRLVGVQEPSQPSRLVGPDELRCLPVNYLCRLSKKLLQVTVICSGFNRGE